MRHLILLIGLTLSITAFSQEKEPKFLVTSKVQVVEEEAEFPGGHSEFLKYFGQHLKTPKVLKDQKKGGVLYVRFVIGTDGSAQNIAVVEEIPGCQECSDIVIEVLQNMPKWKPGSVDGKPVKSFFRMPVTFKV